MLNPRGLLGDVLGHALPSHPVPFFMFGKLKKSYTYKTYRSLTDGSGTDFPSFVQFSRLVTELFGLFRFDAYKFMLPFQETRKRQMSN